MADPISITLTQEQYEALIALVREGTKNDAGQVNHDKALGLDTFLRNIEKENNIVRHAVWIQWQELDSPLPPGTNFPEVWPPQMRVYIEHVTRPIARADIDDVLTSNAKNPTSVLYTRDPGAKYGWTPIDEYS